MEEIEGKSEIERLRMNCETSHRERLNGGMVRKRDRHNSMEACRCYSRPPRRTANHSHPWLLICHGQERQRQTFYDLLEDRYYTKIVADMRNKYCYSTNISEWLVLEDKDSLECQLWNINSSCTVKIPSSGEDVTNCMFILSSPPQGDTNGHIMLIDRDKNILQFCALGEDAFQQRTIGLQNHDERFDYGVVFKGAIYLMTSYCTLFEVKIVAASSLQVTELTSGDLSNLRPPWIYSFQHYLVESNDELLLVLRLMSVVTRKTLNFLVFRMNLSQRVWERVKSLGEKTLFLSADGTNTLSFPPSDPRMKKNSIYYALGKQRSLYLFDMEDHSISILLPCPIVNRRSSEFKWIMI
ncbi:hypothetical protein CRG98_002953 [Punica granatum]|uniref:KIB1-4 beta-propeller domain-containing protein n=1 Tax=Punica granatum TaxID=22663 RepID=A0A2I0L7F9_PUNGR|nr:hypothetical protein CRG98_002953 [Punica granatum]